MTIDGDKINGNMPKKQLKMIEAWIEIHREELFAAWYAYNNDGEIIKKAQRIFSNLCTFFFYILYSKFMIKLFN